VTTSDYLRMFSDDPVLIALVALVLFIIVVPIIAGWIEWRRRKRNGDALAQPADPPATRFLGTQLDLALLVMGALLLVGVATWLYKAFAR
jgi:uncharacterized iron-regulated membrane protein